MRCVVKPACQNRRVVVTAPSLQQDKMAPKRTPFLFAPKPTRASGEAVLPRPQGAILSSAALWPDDRCRAASSVVSTTRPDTVPAPARRVAHRPPHVRRGARMPTTHVGCHHLLRPVTALDAPAAAATPGQGCTILNTRVAICGSAIPVAWNIVLITAKGAWRLH